MVTRRRIVSPQRQLVLDRLSRMKRDSPTSTSRLGNFGKNEIWHLIIATLVLTVAFTLVWVGGIRFFSIPIFIQFFPLMFIVTVTGFACHELAHKFMAQKFRLPAEFKISKFGMVVALVSAMIGFLVALPGAVWFQSDGRREHVGKVALAGPALNIGIALAFFVPTYTLTWLLPVVFVNLFLAGFNMLPFGPLDGKKIWRWNKNIFFVTWLAIATILCLVVIV